MKNLKHPIILILLFVFFISNSFAQRGYYDAAYKRYEADSALLNNGAVKTAKSFSQKELQSEASNQVSVAMNSEDASLGFIINEEADGLVIRYSVPDSSSAVLAIYKGSNFIANITLTCNWSWEYLWSNGDPNNVGISNKIPRMRFDEVRYKLPSKLNMNDTLNFVRVNGNILLDFIELELVPDAITAPVNAAVYAGNGSDLQTFINSNGGKTIFLPANIYSVNSELYFGVANSKLQGAGMWYTQINFTSHNLGQGGIRANTTGTSLSDLYLTTNHASRTNGYKAINGVFSSNSIIENVWAEHFVCGAWIAQYNIGGPSFADGFSLKNCRFRNNYADGINLCKGTSNAIVEHCNFRNNGDDDQAIWSANGLECINNTFRFNTSEHCWRAAGVAIYGGKNNKAHNLLIKDNLEVGLRINNNFPGVGFNDLGLHEFYDISIIACGTFNDLYHNPVAAIDIFCNNNSAGTQVKNCKFSNINILDSKNDAISFYKVGGDGIYNFVFENIDVKGTGLEYPHNNFKNLNWGRGYFVLFANQPNGNATYCNMKYANRGGNATSNVETFGIGTFSWTNSSNCILAVNQNDENNFVKVYPNPTSKELTVELSNDEMETQICLYNIQGELIFEHLSKNKIEKINLKKMQKGIYFLKLQNNRINFVEKIIVE